MATQIEQVVDSTGTILNQYILTKEDSTTEDVFLTFNPSDDYVQGTPFNATYMNTIVNLLNSLSIAVDNYKFVALSQSEYNALSAKDENTLYFVYED